MIGVTDHALALDEWTIVLSAPHRLPGGLASSEMDWPFPGGAGRPFSWHEAASRPCSSHFLELHWPHLMCLSVERPGSGSQLATAGHTQHHFQVILISEAVT